MYVGKVGRVRGSGSSLFIKALERRILNINASRPLLVQVLLPQQEDKYRVGGIPGATQTIQEAH